LQEDVPLLTYLYIVQIIIAIALIIAILVQARETDLGSIFGGGSSVYRTRRGVEKVLYNATIGLAIAFLLISLVIVMIAK
jgi:preprotein translocase subunit SecG